MDTASLVQAILRKNETIPIGGGAESVHTLITRCQNVLYSKVSNNSIYIDPLTGVHPTLPVIAGQRQYDIPNVTMFIDGFDRDISFSKCEEIYVLDEKVQDYGLLNTFNRLRNQKWIERVDDRWILPVHSYEAIDGTPARVIFRYAPELTSSDIVHHVSLIRPLPVTDDSIPLMVSERWHEALIDGVLGMTEYYDFGRSDRLQTFNDYWCSLFWESSDNMPRINQASATPQRRF